MEWIYFAGGIAVGVILTLALKGLFKPVVTRHQIGPSAPPPRAPAPAAAPVSAPSYRVETSPGNCTIILRNGGANKIMVIKAIRELTGLGLKEAKDRVDLAPSEILRDVSRYEAERAAKLLRDAGAEAEIR
jgi:large subunit ribosomal protein L7/L12